MPGDKDHIMYVWLDALANYLTSAGLPPLGDGGGYGGRDTGDEGRGGDEERGGEAFAARWPADVHMVGKDILRFHAVYWPAFLLAADLPVPETIFTHGWWTVEVRQTFSFNFMSYKHSKNRCGEIFSSY